MNVPVSVWLSAIVLFVYSIYVALQNPLLWFQCLGIVIIFVSLVRVVHYLIARE